MGSENLLMGYFGIATFAVWGLLNFLHLAAFVHLQVFKFLRFFFNIFCSLCRSMFIWIYQLFHYEGGAMKQTTDGRWAHLACAIWLPGFPFADYIGLTCWSNSIQNILTKAVFYAQSLIFRNLLSKCQENGTHWWAKQNQQGMCRCLFYNL